MCGVVRHVCCDVSTLRGAPFTLGAAATEPLAFLSRGLLASIVLAALLVGATFWFEPMARSRWAAAVRNRLTARPLMAEKLSYRMWPNRSRDQRLRRVTIMMTP